MKVFLWLFMQERIKVNGWEDWDTDMEWGQALLSGWHPISVQKHQRDRWRRWRVKMQNPHLKGKQRKMIITVVPNVKSIYVHTYFHVSRWRVRGASMYKNIIYPEYYGKEKYFDERKNWQTILLSFECVSISLSVFISHFVFLHPLQGSTNGRCQRRLRSQSKEWWATSKKKIVKWTIQQFQRPASQGNQVNPNSLQLTNEMTY